MLVLDLSWTCPAGNSCVTAYQVICVVFVQFQSLIAHILELEGAKKRIEKELAAERYK